jgi:hypothetical protein
MKYLTLRSNRFAIALLLISAFAVASFGQKTIRPTKMVDESFAPTASVTPVYFPPGPGGAGNPSCATLNGMYPGGVGDIRFSHIITDNELKLDFSNPSGTFPYTSTAAGNPNPRIVVGPQSSTQSVTISSDSDEIFSWSSTIQVTAVIMKMGNAAYVYPYKPFKNSDTNLKPSETFPDHSIGGLSHVTFCFGDPTGPTAGEATVTGRVIDASGMGISKAQMVLVNGATGETKITMTNPFGYYRFDGLDLNELYVVNVSHKRHTFTESQRPLLIGDSVADVDFVASPQ